MIDLKLGAGLYYGTLEAWLTFDHPPVKKHLLFASNFSSSSPHLQINWWFGILKLFEFTHAYWMDMLWYSRGLMNISGMLWWISIISWLLICRVASTHLHKYSVQIDLWHGRWIHHTTPNASVHFGHALLNSQHFLDSDYQVSHFQEECLLDWCQTWPLNWFQAFFWLISILSFSIESLPFPGQTTGTIFANFQSYQIYLNLVDEIIFVLWGPDFCFRASDQLTGLHTFTDKS